VQRPYIRSCLQRSRRRSSRITRSSGKIGQLQMPRPLWCSTFGSGLLIRFISQSMSSHRSDSVSIGESVCGRELQYPVFRVFRPFRLVRLDSHGL
jgi:hypothetical protein